MKNPIKFHFSGQISIEKMSGMQIILFSITFKVTDNDYDLGFELYTHLKQRNVRILKITSAKTKKCPESDIPMFTKLPESVGASKGMEIVLHNVYLKIGSI